MRAALLFDAHSDDETYVGDDLLPVDMGLELRSVHSSDLTEVGNYAVLEERSMVGSAFLAVGSDNH